MIVAQSLGKTTSPWLTRTAAMRVLALCHEGARSIDAVLHRSQANWTNLRQYYGDDKRQLIKVALGDLGLDSTSVVASGVSLLHARSIWFSWFAFLANKWRTQWALSENERLFVGSALQRLSRFLETQEQPPHADLVQLRMDLTGSAGILDRVLSGVRGWDYIQRVEYYAPPAGKNLISIRDLLRMVDEDRYV